MAMPDLPERPQDQRRRKEYGTSRVRKWEKAMAHALEQKLAGDDDGLTKKAWQEGFSLTLDAASEGYDLREVSVLRDLSQRVLGTIRKRSDDTLEVRNSSNKFRGSYDPTSDETRDATGRLIGTGNLLAALLVNEAKGNPSAPPGLAKGPYWDYVGKTPFGAKPKSDKIPDHGKKSGGTIKQDPIKSLQNKGGGPTHPSPQAGKQQAARDAHKTKMAGMRKQLSALKAKTAATKKARKGVEKLTRQLKKGKKTEGRDYKKEYHSYHGTSEQRKNRSERNKARRKMELETGDEREVDHSKPLSQGGTNHKNNLKVVSFAKNRVKGATYEDRVLPPKGLSVPDPAYQASVKRGKAAHAQLRKRDAAGKGDPVALRKRLAAAKAHWKSNPNSYSKDLVDRLTKALKAAKVAKHEATNGVEDAESIRIKHSRYLGTVHTMKNNPRDYVVAAVHIQPSKGPVLQLYALSGGSAGAIRKATTGELLSYWKQSKGQKIKFSGPGASSLQSVVKTLMGKGPHKVGNDFIVPMKDKMLEGVDTTWIQRFSEALD